MTSDSTSTWHARRRKLTVWYVKFPPSGGAGAAQRASGMCNGRIGTY